MDIVVTIVAWAVIVLAATILLVSLLRPKVPNGDIGERVASLLGCAASVILAGRALGWW